ncbi:MAG: sulfotransferase family 2 domain-containing protein [Methyloceanibacter sp.]
MYMILRGFRLARGDIRRLFIHIPKNAGTAVMRVPTVLDQTVAVNTLFLSPAYRRSLAKAGRSNHRHARLVDVSNVIRQRLRPFAVIRNPWSRVVSRYTFTKKQSLREGSTSFCSFEEFLEERHLHGERDFYWHCAMRGWGQQVEYVVDETGAIACDLLRFEFLDADLSTYLQRVVNVPHIRSSNNRDYRSFYSSRSIQIVADWHAADIETFGFDFDTPAQRAMTCNAG